MQNSTVQFFLLISSSFLFLIFFQGRAEANDDLGFETAGEYKQQSESEVGIDVHCPSKLC